MNFRLAKFLDGTLSAKGFDHAAHVEAAFALLSHHDFANAAAQYSQSIKKIATAAGAPEKFHMTITLAMLSLIAERRAKDDQNDYRTFAERNPELFEPGLLARHYSNDRLNSDQARKTFLLPDLA